MFLPSTPLLTSPKTRRMKLDDLSGEKGKEKYIWRKTKTSRNIHPQVYIAHIYTGSHQDGDFK